MRLSRNRIVLFGLAGLVVLLVAGALSPVSFRTSEARAQTPAPDEDDDPKAWLGVNLQNLDDDLRDALDLDEAVDGALVTGVAYESPADDAGIREGDVIVSINGSKTGSVKLATDKVGSFNPGDEVAIVVNRRGRERTYQVTLASRENSDSDVVVVPKSGRRIIVHSDEDDDDSDSHQGSVMFAPRANRSRGYLGVQTMELGSQLAEYFDVPKGQGVLVTEVVEDSPAEAAGIRAGDVILDVDGEEVESHMDLRDLIQDNDPEDSVKLGVSRRGEKLSIEVKLGDASEFGGNVLFVPETPMAFGRHDFSALRNLYFLDAPERQARKQAQAARKDALLLREHMQQLRKELAPMRHRISMGSGRTI